MLLRPGSGEEDKIKAMAMTTTSTTTATTGHGYCFSDTPVVDTTTTTTEFQSFDDDGDSNQQQIYGLTTTGMDMIRGTELIPNKNLHHQTTTTTTTNEANSSLIWKDLFVKTSSSNHQEGPSVVVTTGNEELIYQQTDFSAGENTLMVDNRVILDGVVEEDQEQDNPSLIRCIFPCQGNERPSQGLSLSLGSSSNNPNSSSTTTIGLQSFELRQPPPPPPPPHHQEDLIRFFPTNSRDDGFFDKSVNIHQQQMIMMMQAGAGINHIHHPHPHHPHPHHHHHQQQQQHNQVQFHIRSSKYLAPAQELLNEFCNLGCTNQNDITSSSSKLLKLQKNNQWQQQQQQNQDQENAPTTNTATKILQQSQNLYSLDLLELQKRKTKLLQMLEEVDRRYKHYCNQMRAVVASFESVAGNGTAFVYSALALKAMSKHFRCLKDGIVNQIKATKNALGEKDSITNGPSGTTRGETPRLRLIDQTLRQQKAFQQMSMMESHPWRPQRGLPERAVSVLRAWLFEHFLHPYPSDVDKHILARQTGLSRSQVSNWFINARVRLWKPMVEEMYLEETKECDNMGSSDGEHHPSMDGTTITSGGRRRQNQNFIRTDHHHQDEEKPTPDQLVRIDSECLSSIINSNNNINNPHEKNVAVIDDDNHNHHHLHGFGRVTDSFGAMELDFSSYNHHQQNIRGGGGGSGNVSLTLGLQQQGNAGVNLAFSSPTSQNSMFFGREQPIVEDCCPPAANVVHHHHHQYSLLDSEAQNLPYRNLMGAQLLHDLAG